jgi:hypothetical protein
MIKTDIGRLNNGYFSGLIDTGRPNKGYFGGFSFRILPSIHRRPLLMTMPLSGVYLQATEVMQRLLQINEVFSTPVLPSRLIKLSFSFSTA